MSESKLDLSILKSEVDFVGCYIIRMDHSRREVEIDIILKNHYLIIISQVFVLMLTAFFRRFLPKSKPLW